jgi:hypothetical protein
MYMSIIQKFIHSLVGQFIIGGLTVGGIAYFSNHINNTAIAGVIAAMPIGMPSSIFVDDDKVVSYSKNLLDMSFVLIIATFQNWYLLSHTKMSKYDTVGLSMLTFFVLGIVYIKFIAKK